MPSGNSSMYILIGVAALVFFVFILLTGLFRRYKRCPSDKILVVYGKVGSKADGGGLSSKCIHGGAAFIWPIIQEYAFLSLTPISIEVNLTGALSRQNIRVDVPSRFTVGISTEPGVMTNAAERLLGLNLPQIHDLAKDIIIGQLRLVIAMMDIEEINANRDKFLANVAGNVEIELKKIGLRLINVNITDIKDESGYIEALGKEAAAKAINDARVSVSEKNRDGSIGEANAQRDQRVKVSEAVADAKIGEANATQKERTNVATAEANAKMGEADAQQRERIAVAEANAKAVEGENKAKINIADSESERRERAAEAERKAITAEKVTRARALEESYSAEQAAETRRADRDMATRTADIVIPAQIDKQKIEIDAEAQAEQTRRRAKGEADAIYLKMEAEAKGIYEILSKQAEGFEKLVKAAGDSSKDAVMLMIVDKLPELVRMQSEAIRNIKIDKITVWDGGQGAGGNGSSTSNFISNLYKSVPPLQDVFNQAGLNLPQYLQGTVHAEKKDHSNDHPKKEEEK